MGQPIVDPDELDPSGELAAQIAAQQHEYGHYVANQKIYVGGGLAYDVGHQVPVSNVVRHSYWLNGQVDLVDGKEHPPEVAATMPQAEEPAAQPAQAAAARGRAGRAQPVADAGDQSTPDTEGAE